jgi:hypothetical protein
MTAQYGDSQIPHNTVQHFEQPFDRHILNKIKRETVHGWMVKTG